MKLIGEILDIIMSVVLFLLFVTIGVTLFYLLMRYQALGQADKLYLDIMMKLRNTDAVVRFWVRDMQDFLYLVRGLVLR